MKPEGRDEGLEELRGQTDVCDCREKAVDRGMVVVLRGSPEGKGGALRDPEEHRRDGVSEEVRTG